MTEPVAAPVPGRRRSGRRSTDRALADSADSHAYVNGLLAGIPDPVVIVDVQGRIVRSNRAFQDGALGLPSGTDTGARLKDVFARSTVAEIAQRTLQHIAAGEPVDGALAFEVTGSDGTLVQCRLSVLGRQQPDGPQWMLHLRDQGELALARAQRDAVVQFVSHDLRATQSSMLSIIEFGRMRNEGFDKKLLERIELLAWQAIGLSDRFAKLIRVQSQQIERTELHLADCIVEAMDSSWVDANAKHVSFVFERASVDGTLAGSRSILVDALTELLGHAVRRSIPTSKIYVSMEARERGFAARIRYSGEEGLLASELEALQDERTRAARLRTTRSRSTDLHLAYVREAVARHNGRIAAADLGDGSCELALLFA